MLSSESSALSGKWHNRNAPYLVGPMEAISDPGIEEVIIMSAAQVGKSECLLNTIGRTIDREPSPILFLMPTTEMAQAMSKDRIQPMIRDTPCLRNKVADPRSRDSGSTALHKVFSGGHLTLAGANSSASLSARPIRYCLLDEVSRYPKAIADGSPIMLAKKRTVSFFNKKIVQTSTPTTIFEYRLRQVSLCCVTSVQKQPTYVMHVLF